MLGYIKIFLKYTVKGPYTVPLEDKIQVSYCDSWGVSAFVLRKGNTLWWAPMIWKTNTMSKHCNYCISYITPAEEVPNIYIHFHHFNNGLYTWNSQELTSYDMLHNKTYNYLKGQPHYWDTRHHKYIRAGILKYTEQRMSKLSSICPPLLHFIMSHNL